MMKKFYFLLVQIALLLCIFLGAPLLLSQTTTSVAGLRQAPNKSDEKRFSIFSPQNGRSAELRKNLATYKGKIPAGIQKKTAETATILSAKSFSENIHTVANRSRLKSIDSGRNITARITAIDIPDTPRIKTDLLEDTLSNQLSPLALMKGKVEDLPRRDASSKHFKNADGSYTALIGAVPLHYKNNGKWEEIDTKIRKATSGEYVYANTANLMESYFGSSVHQGILSKTKEGAVKEFLNTKIYWEVDGKEVGTVLSANSEVNVKGNEAYYNNLYGDISAEFLIETGKRKLNYIIPDKKALGNIPTSADYLVFSEDVILPQDWTHSLTKRGILIKDQNANTHFIYTNPISTDLSENLEIENTIYESLLTGQTLTLRIKVQTKWLLSEDRKFPVYVDPTVNCFVNNSDPSGYAPTGTVTSNGLFITSLNDDLASGAATVSSAVRTLNGFAKFIISSIPAGSTINSAIATDRISSNTTYGTNGHSWRSCLIDPAAAATTAAQIYAQGATLFWTANSYTGTGNGTQALNAAGRTAIQNSLGQGWFAMVMKPVQNEPWRTGEYIKIVGRNGNTTLPPGGTTYRPYLVIDYTPSSTSCQPVTASASKYSVCSGEAVILSATSSTPGYTYTWYTDWNNDTHSGTLVGTGASVTVNPTVSTLYGVVATKSGCQTGVKAVYALLTVGVNPTPTVIVLDPINAVTCSNEVQKVQIVDGGIVTPFPLNENFNTSSADTWTTYTEYVPNGYWTLKNSDGDLSAPDNSRYAFVGSYEYYFPAFTSILQTPPISLKDYSNPINLTFKHMFWTDGGTIGFVEISQDGGQTWSEIETYTSDIGADGNFKNATINLNSFAANEFILLRFRYQAVANDWFWAIDDVQIQGNQLSTTVTWSPAVGLWMDSNKTTPYTGQNTATVYASPAATTSYTVSAKTAAGCPSTQTVVVTKGDTDWSGTTTNWNTASNWEGNTVPTADHCVNIPSSTVRPVISVSTEAHAKNLTIQPGGSLDIKGNLTVQDFVKNLGDKRALILSSDANLLQLNAVAANSGEITAHREITIKDNNQYNYLISPLIDSNLKTNIYENKTTGVLSSSQFTLYHNEVNNKFYTSSGAYIRGRGLAVKEPSASVVSPGGKIYAHFTGVPMNGDFTYTLANSGTPTTGYNLIGNPYPSNIDIKKLYDNSPGQISENFEFWDNLANAITVQQGSEYKGAAYAIFNAATGTYGVGNPAPGNTEVDPDNPASPAGSKIPNHIVKVGQGFMVRAIGAGVLNFKNTQRTKDQTDSNFYGRNQTVITDDRYWLQLTTPSDMVISNAIVYFDSGNNEFSKDDSKETGTSDALFTYAGTEKVVINGRNKFNIDDILDIGTRNYTAGINKIALGRKEGIFATSEPIYLKDNQTGTITNLSEGAYTFMAQAGESTGRFEIVYKPGGVLATDATVKEDVVVYRDGQDFVVKAQRGPITSVEIFDAAGRMVHRVEPNSTVERLDFSAIVNGTYILKIDQKGKITVKKVIK